MKCSPTGRLSHVRMIRPCLIEQGMGRTSITLSEPMRFSVCMSVFMCVFVCLKISNAGCRATNFCHHRRMPWRIPKQFDFGVVHARKIEKHVDSAEANAFVHGASLRGEGHRNSDFCIRDTDSVNQAEIDNVAAKLRIDHLAQCIQNSRLAEFSAVHGAVGAGIGLKFGAKESSSSLGRMKCENIVPTLNINVPRLTANKMDP